MNIDRWSEQFEKDMQVIRNSQSTRDNYGCQVKMFLAYFEKLNYTSPERINAEKIKDYLLTKISNNNQRHAHSAIKHFYKITVHQELKFRFIQYAEKEKKHPIILSREETKRWFEACTNVKHKCIMLVAYATGVRVAELL